MADALAAELTAIRERHDRARHPEDDDGKLYIAAAAVAVALGEAPGWTVRRSGVSVEVHEDGRGVPAWRVWVERGEGGHLIGDGEFGRSARDVPRLLAAVEAALEVHALTAFHRHTEPCDRHRYRGIADRSRCPDCKVIEWTGCETCRDEYGNPAKAEDCKTRQAITRALPGEEKDGG